MAAADLAIRGGLVADGTGSPLVRADVAVQAGRISRVGDPAGRDATSVIDAAGTVVTPGFIDLHTHADFTLPVNPGAEAAVCQGVTTQVLGNCGLSPFPVDRTGALRRYAEFLDAGLDWSWEDAAGYRRHVDERRPVTNVVLQVGHGTVRMGVLGFDARAAEAEELEAIARQVAAALGAGAHGLSLGLRYPPGSAATGEELAAVCRAAASQQAFVSAHVRSEGARLLDGIREVLTLAGDARVPLQISHLKALGRDQWGQVPAALSLLDEARASGQDVLGDAYPYEATSTTLLALLPHWAADAGPDGAADMAADPTVRARLRAALAEAPPDYEAVILARVPDGLHRPLEGLSLEAAARRAAAEPVDLLLDVVGSHPGGVQVVHHAMDPAEVRAALAHPAVAVASDGWVQHPSEGGRPHPRSYGTFARVLGVLVREEGLLSLEEAVRKMTALPAARLGRAERGVIRPGAVADLVVLDPARVRDSATYEEPHRFADGVEHVVVAGRAVLRGGEPTGARPGSVLVPPRRPE